MMLNKYCEQHNIHEKKRRDHFKLYIKNLYHIQKFIQNGHRSNVQPKMIKILEENMQKHC